MPETSSNPSKKVEFDAFIKTLSKGTVCHWYEIAKALGVDRGTLQIWRTYPEAIQARKDGIKRILDRMEKAGLKDWKMWKTKLNYLDLIETEKSELDVTSDGKRIGGFVQIKRKVDENG